VTYSVANCVGCGNTDDTDRSESLVKNSPVLLLFALFYFTTHAVNQLNVSESAHTHACSYFTSLQNYDQTYKHKCTMYKLHMSLPDLPHWNVYRNVPAKHLV